MNLCSEETCSNIVHFILSWAINLKNSFLAYDGSNEIVFGTALVTSSTLLLICHSESRSSFFSSSWEILFN